MGSKSRKVAGNAPTVEQQQATQPASEGTVPSAGDEPAQDNDTGALEQVADAVEQVADAVADEAKQIVRSIEEELEELGLKVEAEGHVLLEMLTGLSGPILTLVRGDPHSCAPDEAVRLVRAGYAKPRS